MSDPTLYLYTSLTAGSSHIVTATARLETILKANRLPFRAIDVATDDAARKLWGRRAKGKKLPGLVKYGTIVGDLEQIEEWNEFGELRMEVNSVQDLGGTPAAAPTEPQSESKPATTEPDTPKPSTIKIQSPPATKPEEKKDEKAVLALRQASQEAASKAKDKANGEDSATEKAPKQEIDAGTTKPAAHRGSVAAELPDTEPESPKGAKRPLLVPEVAAMSSANFHADNTETLGLVEHHRGSIISADNVEQSKALHDIRQSISTSSPEGSVEAIRKEAAQRSAETIEGDPLPEAEDGATDAKESVKEDTKKDIKEDVKEDTKDDVKEYGKENVKDNSEESTAGPPQESKSAEATAPAQA